MTTLKMLPRCGPLGGKIRVDQNDPIISIRESWSKKEELLGSDGRVKKLKEEDSVLSVTDWVEIVLGQPCEAAQPTKAI